MQHSHEEEGALGHLIVLVVGFSIESNSSVVLKVDAPFLLSP